MKILHSADWHVRDADIEEITRCLEKITFTAMEETPDLIVIAGDLFHSADVKLDSPSAKLVIKMVSILADYAPVAIVIGTPSHDGKAAEILEMVRGKYPVRVASRPMQVILKDDGRLFDIEYLNTMNSGKIEAVISLIPQPTKQFFQGEDQQIADAMSGIFAGFGARAAEFDCPHVLVYHGLISGAKMSTGQDLTGLDISIGRDQIELSGSTLTLCGHIHLPQELPGNIFYSGDVYPENWGENHDHGFYLHEIDDNSPPIAPLFIQSRFIKTPCRKLIRFREDWTDHIVDDYSIANMGPNQDIEGASVRIDIKVFQDEAGQVNKQAIIDSAMDSGASAVDIRLIRVPRVTVRSESVRKAISLRQKVLADAEIKGEMVPESLLVKADLLETMPVEELIAEVSL